MARCAPTTRRMKAGRWGGFAGYDGWVARANNASFGAQAAYDELVPASSACSSARAATSRASTPRCRRLAALPDEQRRATLPP